MKQTNLSSTENPQIQVQKAIFEEIKEKIKKTEISLVDDLASLLNVSTDSAYRRIRCDKFITIDELEKICKHYKISYDKHLAINHSNAVFNYSLNRENVSFEGFLQGILADLKNINAKEDHKLIFSIKDFPLFHLFEIPELTIFKMFYWMKTLIQQPEYDSIKFSFDLIPQKYIDLAKEISREYKATTTYEIWNYESIHSILAQFEYYTASGILKREDAILLTNKLKELILHIKKQAEQEKKFVIKSKEFPEKKNYNFYLSEIILCDNTIVARFDDISKCYIPHALLYYMSTYDKNYGDHMHNILSSVMKKSTLISGTAEKHRSIYFNYVLEKVEECKKRLEK